MKNISTLFLLILAFGLSGCFFQEENPEEKEALVSIARDNLNAINDLQDKANEYCRETGNPERIRPECKRLDKLADLRAVTFKEKHLSEQLQKSIHEQEQLLGCTDSSGMTTNEKYQALRKLLFKPDLFNLNAARKFFIYSQLCLFLHHEWLRGFYESSTMTFCSVQKDSIKPGETFQCHVYSLFGDSGRGLFKAEPHKISVTEAERNGEKIATPSFRNDYLTFRHEGVYTNLLTFKPEKEGTYRLHLRIECFMPETKDLTDYPVFSHEELITFNVFPQ